MKDHDAEIVAEVAEERGRLLSLAEATHAHSMSLRVHTVAIRRRTAAAPTAGVVVQRSKATERRRARLPRCWTPASGVPQTDASASSGTAEQRNKATQTPRSLLATLRAR